MSLQEIKESLVELSEQEQREVMAFLLDLREGANSPDRDDVTRRLDNKNPSHWLTPDQFERELDKQAGA